MRKSILPGIQHRLKKTVFCAGVTASSFLFGQDIHFSQFTEHPALINPALTGAVNTMRSSVGYKNQWRSVASPYKTYGVSYEMRFRPDSWQQVDKHRGMTFREKTMSHMAAGLSVYNDKAGDGSLGLTQANLSVASFVPLSKASFLSLGLQASLAQRKLNSTSLVFPSQYSGSGYSADLPSGENFTGQLFTYADFAGGMLWTYTRNDKYIAENNQTRMHFGASVYHINRPKQNYFANGGSPLYMRYVLYGDCHFGIRHTNTALAPSFLFQMQGTSTELLAGMLFKYYIKIDSRYTGIIKRSCLSYGAYYRNRDALILNVGIEWREQLAMGLSYDINMSPLATASQARGGVELMLKYTPPNAFLYQKKASIDAGN